MKRFLAAVLAVAFVPAAFGQDAGGKLRVGVFDKPPFAMKTADGRWTGLAVVLWDEIAAELHLPFEFVEVPQEKMTGELIHGNLDLCVGEMAVTAERQLVTDFSQPYLSYPAAVAIHRRDGLPSLMDVAHDLPSNGLLPLIGAMIFTLLLFSFLLWIVERRIKSGHFGGTPLHGFGSALWFAAVTMTTVGYGDKTPQSPIGRTIALLWMFSGILLVSAFTGTVASSLSVARMNSKITRFSDLSKFRNGVMEGTVIGTILDDAGIPATSYPTVEEGLKALANRNGITSFVSNGITLRYLVNKYYPDTLQVILLPTTHVHYAIETRLNLPIMRQLNYALLRLTSLPDWQREVDHFIGPAEAQ